MGGGHVEPPDYVLVVVLGHVVKHDRPVAQTHRKSILVRTEFHSQNRPVTLYRLLVDHRLRITYVNLIQPLLIEHDLVDLREVVDLLNVAEMGVRVSNFALNVTHVGHLAVARVLALDLVVDQVSCELLELEHFTRGLFALIKQIDQLLHEIVTLRDL